MRLVLKYIKTYWLTSAFIGYMVVTTFLKAFTSFDATIPCFIRLCTGHRCYGCGLTTSVTYLLHFDFIGAFESNPLVFVVLPTLAYLLVRHWRRFVQKQRHL